jgi:hypothetical protein
MRALACLFVLPVFAVASAAHAEGDAPQPQPQPAPTTSAAPAAPAAATPASLAESLSGPAQDAYVSARILFNNKDLVGAYTKFQQAYELSHDPRLLFNMAVCSRDLHAYARMQVLLLRYEQEGGAAMTDSTRAQVDSALAAIANLVGAVNLNVSEEGASVTVDGQPAGTTPLGSPLRLDLGRHTLVVHKDGFESVQKLVDVAGGTSFDANITLAPAQAGSAHLAVSAEPGATVVVDALAPAVEHFDQAISAGTHHVRVTEPGKIAYDTDVELKDGETRTMQITLQPGKRGLGAWPWVVGGAAVAAGAIVGGYFLFKPSDRVIAPQGILGTVYLN